MPSGFFAGVVPARAAPAGGNLDGSARFGGGGWRGDAEPGLRLPSRCSTIARTLNSESAADPLVLDAARASFNAAFSLRPKAGGDALRPSSLRPPLAPLLDPGLDDEAPVTRLPPLAGLVPDAAFAGLAATWMSAHTPGWMAPTRTGSALATSANGSYPFAPDPLSPWLERWRASLAFISSARRACLLASSKRFRRCRVSTACGKCRHAHLPHLWLPASHAQPCVRARA